MENLKKENRGFTIIELVVVMIIIGILVLLATPRYVKYIKMARYTNIINDLRILETVSLPIITRDGRLPEGTSEEGVSDFSSEIRERKLYAKDGNVVKNKVDFFFPEVGRVSEKYGDDLGNYYLMDRKNFVKPETGTRLKGDFYINQDGQVLYIDVKSASEDINKKKEKEEEMQVAELFKYRENIDGTLKIIDKNPENTMGWIKYKDKQGGLIFPEIPKSKIYEENGEIIEKDITAIGAKAFMDVKFTGDFIAPHIKIIENIAFNNAKFTGKFYAPELEEVWFAAFVKSEFTGEFNCPKIKSISSAFENSKFTGKIKLDNVESIGNDTFANSNFTGDFYAPKIKRIGDNAFKSSDFGGIFYAPLVENIGYGHNVSAFGGGEKFTSYIPNNSDMINKIKNNEKWKK